MNISYYIIYLSIVWEVTIICVHGGVIKVNNIMPSNWLMAGLKPK